jgi:hypothetical protein
MQVQIFRTIIALALFVVISAASANAQSGGTFAVPFDFHAGRHTLAPGTYTITQVSTRLLELRSEDGAASVLVEAPLTARAPKKRETARLVFRRYGDHYFLAQVWSSASAGRELSRSDAERSLVEERESAGTVATIEVKSK